MCSSARDPSFGFLSNSRCNSATTTSYSFSLRIRCGVLKSSAVVTAYLLGCQSLSRLVRRSYSACVMTPRMNNLFSRYRILADIRYLFPPTSKITTLFGRKPTLRPKSRLMSVESAKSLDSISLHHTLRGSSACGCFCANSRSDFHAISTRLPACGFQTLAGSVFPIRKREFPKSSRDLQRSDDRNVCECHETHVIISISTVTYLSAIGSGLR